MVTGASRGIGLETARQLLCARRPQCCSWPVRASASRRPWRHVRRPAARAAALTCDVTESGRRRADARRSARGPGRTGRAGQQRRRRALARPRGRAGRGLAGRLGGERDGRPPRDAGVRPRDARARMGPGGERVEHGGQAALGQHARVLRREGRPAVAVAAVGRPLRGRRRAGERDLPGTDEVGAVGRRGRARRPVRRAVGPGRTRRGAREGRLRAGRSAGSRRSRRSRRRSCSCARSALPTWPEPPGASTAARCR